MILPGKLMHDLNKEFLESGGKKKIDKNVEKLIFKIFKLTFKQFAGGHLAVLIFEIIVKALNETIETGEDKENITKMLMKVMVEIFKKEVK